MMTPEERQELIHRPFLIEHILPVKRWAGCNLGGYLVSDASGGHHVVECGGRQPYQRDGVYTLLDVQRLIVDDYEEDDADDPTEEVDDDDPN